MEAPNDEESDNQLSAEFYYESATLHSRPFITPKSDIPENLLHLWHSFGYDSGRGANLHLLDERTLVFVAGNILVLLDIESKLQKYLRSCSGGGIGCVTSYPTREYFAVAEKGNQPDIIVYEYPSLRPYRVLRGGTECAYSFADFNIDGSLLASIGCAPDYMLTLWDWRQEQVLLSCKAISQEVYRVTFSPYEPDSLTTSGSQHIKFWKMASTFTGLKLQGQIGRFGKTPASDIEGYVEFPDGKVLSGASWGNLLLWDGSTIKVEICRKDGKSCHVGMSQPFALEDELVMTMGSDGVIRGWDFESINTAIGNASNRYEMEPINEMMVGHNVSLSFAVKSSMPDSFTWFAQDSRGAIWKLDLSFLSLAPDPECLFCFHAGPIKGLDVSNRSFLMATTSLDRLVKVFDFLTKKELTSHTFNQGGTTVCWAPSSVDQTGGLIVTGFEDGVVRLLDVYDPHKLSDVHHERRPVGEAKLRLKQAFKPHNEPVTAVAFDRNGKVLATGSSDGTVFFFMIGKKYRPIGFICVPGPVQALEWSPPFHPENRLLILCQSGHAVEVPCPDLIPPQSTKTFLLSELPTRVFRFRSIKSQIKRNLEIAKRQAAKEQKKKEKEESGKKSLLLEPEPKEEEEELPPIYIPEDPSPLFCGFYSQPNQFWISMGDYDTGYLYHCKFSEEQDQDENQRQDEPFGFIPVDNAEEDSICSITFSSDRQMMLCGMLSGFIRVYPLQPQDYSLRSMKAYWALSVHDNQYGHLHHVKWSHDDQFVLTAGNDGNIFSFSLTPPSELQERLHTMRVKIPTPRPGFEHEELAFDIEDPAAYSIETAKQKQEEDRLRKEVEQRLSAKRKKLAELKHRYQEMLKVNQTLSEHVHLTPEEFQLNQRFNELVEKVKLDVRRQMSWPLERCTIALRKLQKGYKELLETNMVVSVLAISTNDILSTYPLPHAGELSAFFDESSMGDSFDIDATGDAADIVEPSTDGEGSSSEANQADANVSLTKPSKQEGIDIGRRVQDAAAAPALKSQTDPEEDSLLEDEEDLSPPMARPTGVKLTAKQEERLRKADERAVKAQAEIEKRKQKWEQLYLEMPGEKWEDPQCVEAIRKARENIGDLKLKSDGDYVVPKHLRMNAQQKRAQLIGLETKICQEKSEMNKRIIALRDSKISLMDQLYCHAEEIREIQKHLGANLHCSIPTVPTLRPKEIPDKKFQCTPATLEQYCILKDKRSKMSSGEQEDDSRFLVELEEEMRRQEEEEHHEKMKAGSLSQATFVLTLEEKEEEMTILNQGIRQSELEEMVLKEEDLKLLHQQKLLLEEMEKSVRHFDMEHQLLRNENLRLSMQLNMADLEQLMLFQELLILEESKTKRDALQQKLNTCIKEENNIVSKLKEGTQQLELKRAEIVNLQERETALVAALQSSVSMTKFKDFLTKVFWKKIKNVKNKGQAEDEDDSDEEESDSDESDSDEDDVDDSVCPPGCEPDLFEFVLKLRKRRFDLEEVLTEKKKSCDTLKRTCDFLSEKEKLSKSSLKAVEDDLELLYREDQLKINSLDIMVPLHLNQIAFETNGLVPSDLSQAVLLNRSERRKLQERIDRQQVRNKEQRELNSKARQQVVRLTRDIKDKRILLQDVKQESQLSMMRKFGKLVDMDALMTIGGNRRLEELKQEKQLKEMEQSREIKQSLDKLDEARQTLNQVIIHNTKLLSQKRSFLDQKRELEQKITLRQKKLGRQLQDQWRIADQEVQKLQQVMAVQREKADALRDEISLLCQKGSHVLPEYMLPSQSSSKRQLSIPGRIQQPQSFTGTSRKRPVKSSGHTGMTKLPVLPPSKSSSRT